MSLCINELEAHTLRVLSEDQVAVLVERVRTTLKSERKRLRLTQEQLETRSGVDQPTISRAEAGTLPTLPVLARITDGLGHSLSSFFARIEGLPTRVPSDTTTPQAQQQRIARGDLDGTSASVRRREEIAAELVAVLLEAAGAIGTQQPRRKARTGTARRGARARKSG